MAASNAPPFSISATIPGTTNRGSGISRVSPQTRPRVQTRRSGTTHHQVTLQPPPNPNRISDQNVREQPGSGEADPARVHITAGESRVKFPSVVLLGLMGWLGLVGPNR